MGDMIIRIADIYGRWWALINVYLVIMMSAITVGYIIFDAFGSQSVISYLFPNKDVLGRPEVISGILSVVIGGMVVALIWAYNDSKNRFVWASKARSELNETLSFAYQVGCSSGEGSFDINAIDGNFFSAAEYSAALFNTSSANYAFFHIINYSLMVQFYMTLSGLRRNITAGSENFDPSSRYLMARALVAGVIASRMLGSRATFHVEIVESACVILVGNEKFGENWKIFEYLRRYFPDSSYLK